MPIVRPPARRVVRYAGAATLLAAAPAACADAQPACAAGTVDTYLSLGADGCTIGRFRFSAFDFLSGFDADGGATASSPDDLAMTLTPFTGLDRVGRTTFGFTFTGFTTAVAVDGGTSVLDAGFALAGLGFEVAGRTPGARLARARVDGSIVAASPRPGRLAMQTFVEGEVGAASGDPCLSFLVIDFGPADRSLARRGRCPRPRPTDVEIGLGLFTTLGRDTPDDMRPITGSASGTIARLELTAAGRAAVVPEPSAVVLTATGLLGLAGVAARRRRG